MKTFKTYLPLFPGFYNTYFESDESNEIDSINQERESLGKKPIDYDDCEFDYDEYNKQISENCCEIIQDKLIEFLKTDVKITFEALASPKYYNFSNDSINCTIEIDKEVILKNLLANFEAFKSYIKNKYTSYDGFMSSYSNDANEWILELKKHDFECEHSIGSVLEFICKINEFDSENLYYDCMDIGNAYIYATNYDKLTS